MLSFTAGFRESRPTVHLRRGLFVQWSGTFRSPTRPLKRDCLTRLLLASRADLSELEEAPLKVVKFLCPVPPFELKYKLSYRCRKQLAAFHTTIGKQTANLHPAGAWETLHMSSLLSALIGGLFQMAV